MLVTCAGLASETYDVRTGGSIPPRRHLFVPSIARRCARRRCEVGTAIAGVVRVSRLAASGC
jgi:hypothetical protein